MAHTELTGPDWSATLERMGGAAALEAEGRETKAFERPRKVTCAVDQLRLTLTYCLGLAGLRLTAAWAAGIGLADISNVALLGRLRKNRAHCRHCRRDPHRRPRPLPRRRARPGDR